MNAAQNIVDFEDTDPNGTNPLIRVEAPSYRVKIEVGKQTRDHGCTSVQLHAVTGRKVSANINNISIGSWVSCDILGVELQVWSGRHGWCKPLREAVKAESSDGTQYTDKSPDADLMKATDDAAVALFYKVFALLSPEQISTILNGLSQQAFERGWHAKQRQVSSLLNQMVDSRAPREHA